MEQIPQSMKKISNVPTFKRVALFHDIQKQPSRGVLKERCSENMQQIHRRTPKLFCIFIEIALRHGCSSVNLLDIFRTPFPKNTSGRLLLDARSNDSRSNDARFKYKLSKQAIKLYKKTYKIRIMQLAHFIFAEQKT